MAIELSVSILKSDKRIQNEMFKIILSRLNKEFNKLVPLIRQDIIEEIPKIFINRDVTGIYHALIHGPLNLEFGFPAGTETSRINEIILQIANSIRVTFVPMKKLAAG